MFFIKKNKAENISEKQVSFVRGGASDYRQMTAEEIKAKEEERENNKKEQSDGLNYSFSW